MSEDGTASRRATLPERDPGERHRRRAELRVSSSSRRVARVDDDRLDRRDVGRPRRARRAARRSAGRSPARPRPPRRRVLARAIAARRWNELRVATATRSESSTTPITLPVGERTGKWRIPRSSMSSSTSLPMRSAATVYAGALITCAIGPPRSAPAATTRVRRSRSVMIPSVPSPTSTTTRRRAAVGHHAAPPRGSSCRGAHSTSGRRISSVDRPLRRVDGAAPSRSPVAERLEQRARDVAQPGGPREQRSRHLGADPVAERVLGRDRREAGRQARQHRARGRTARPVPSRSSTRPSWTISTAPRAHDPHVLDRARALLEDLRARRVELDLRRVRHALEVGGLERVEGRMRREEVGDVLQRRRDISLLDSARRREDTREQLESGSLEGGRRGLRRNGDEA